MIVYERRGLFRLARGFRRRTKRGFLCRPIQETKQLVVPVSSILEGFRRISRQRGEGDALQAIAAMQEGTVALLTVPAALESARLSLDE